MSVAFTTRSRTYVQPFRTPEESAREVLQALQAAPDTQAALVFGNETNGLANEEVWQCTFPATIPANPAYSSLNLAAAVQVACYVLARTCEAFAPQAGAIADAPDFVPASHEAVEGLLAQWFAVLERLDFYDPASPKRLEARLRRLLARARLALSLTHEPQRIEITTTPVQEAKIEERLMLIDGFEHKHRLLEKILGDGELQQAVVFTATKRSAEDLTERMIGWGVRAAALHGDMTQRARTRTLDRLRRGEVQVLVATDVAARGIDVAGISHVINFDPPRQAEDYVHRIGRTGRAGRSGVAITLTHPNEMRTIGAIERFTGRRLAEHVIEGLEPRAPRRPAGAGRGGFEGSRGGKPSGPRTPAPRRSEDSPRRWGDSPRSHEGRQERAAAPRAYGETAPRSEFERRVRGDDGDRRTLGVSGERKPRSSWGNKDHHPQRDGEGWGRRRRDR